MKEEAGLVFLSAEEMAEADRAAIEDVGMDVLALMENAGTAVARVARTMIGGSVEGRQICFLVGKGNNGGDALVAARHLANWGCDALVILAGERDGMKDAPARQLEAVEKMGISVGGPDARLDRADLIVDGLLGYGSKGNPREPVAGLIRRANSTGAQILAVDVPSGLNATTGEPGDPCISAKTTVTFGFPKTGFLAEGSKKFVGELYLADISIPGRVYQRYPVRPGVFAIDTLVKVW